MITFGNMSENEHNSTPKQDRRVVAGMATFPKRFEASLEAINSIAPQVNTLMVCVNGDEFYETEERYKLELPHGVLRRVVFYAPKYDMTDAGKFAAYNAPIYDYLLTCDDDLIYPKNYAKSIVNSAEKYGCPVSYHGYNLEPGLSYRRARRDKIHCLHPAMEDGEREVIGTGVACWPKWSLGAWLDLDTWAPKMADLNAAQVAQAVGTKMVALKHLGQWILHSEKVNRAETIWAEVEKDDRAQTKKIMEWKK